MIDERDWQSAQQDRDAHKQGEPGRSKQRHECLKKCSIRMCASRHVDDICHRQSPLSILGRCGLWSEVTIRTWADDAGIPRWRIARRKGVREDLVHRPFGRKARLAIADLVNDAADAYDSRHHRRDGAVSKFDCGSCVKHDCSLRSLLVVVTVSQDLVTQFRPPVEVDEQQPRDDCRWQHDQAEHPDLRRQPHCCDPRGHHHEEGDESEHDRRDL